MTNQEEAEKSLFYIIRKPPEFGKLLNSQKNKGEELRNFTQAEVKMFGTFLCDVGHQS